MINLEDIPGIDTELKMVNEHIEHLYRSNSESMQKCWIGY